MDFEKLRLGELMAGGAAVLLFLTMFLPWYGGQGTVVVTPFDVGANRTAWAVFGFVDVLMVAAIVAAIGTAVLTGSQSSVALPVAGSVIVTTLGGLVTLLVAFRLLNEPGPDAYIEVQPAAHLGLLLCAAIAVGGFMAMRDEGATFGETASALQERWAGEGVEVQPTPAPEPGPPAPDAAPPAPVPVPPAPDAPPGER